MRFYPYSNNHGHFINRVQEWQYLTNLEKTPQAKILIVYGRRRVGKTELLEQFFKNRNLIKFEGIEKASVERQRQEMANKMAYYFEDPSLKDKQYENWIEILSSISEHIGQTGKITLYFEEVQWLADYQHEFIAELKYVWDNYFRYNKDLILILCGSSPSFMKNSVANSRALYNRSQYELPIEEFSLPEACRILCAFPKLDVLDLYLTIGGIPDYLLRFIGASSLKSALAGYTFSKGSFFSTEYHRLFVSSLNDNPLYQKIIEYIAKQRFTSLSALIQSTKSSKESLMRLVEELELCGFIESYIPIDKKIHTLQKRYCIKDHYINYYNNFVLPRIHDIEQIKLSSPLDSLSFLQTNHYQQWCGYQFERFCRRNHRIIAKLMGFSGIDYKAGSYFRHSWNKEFKQVRGYQLDLLFKRPDKIWVICEIKYSDIPVDGRIIDEFNAKILKIPHIHKKHILKVLISKVRPVDSVFHGSYFDKIILAEDLLEEYLWK